MPEGKIIPTVGTKVTLASFPISLRVSPSPIAVAMRRIRAYREHMGWKRGRYAAKAGLHPSTTRYMDDPDWNVSTRVLKALEAIIPPEFDSLFEVSSFAEGDGADG